MYCAVSRHNLNPLLRLFDFPDPNVTSDGRSSTTVPLQQLFVLNSDFMVRSAKAFAERVCEDASDEETRVRLAVSRAYGRPATDREVQLAIEFLAEPNGNEELTRWTQYAQVLLAANEFLFVD
jgi:hypothetical protein